MIADAAAGRMPAYVDTGLNIVHVDDVAEGHALALERGRVGQRYILGGENLTLAELLALVDDVAGPPAAPAAAAAWRAVAAGAGAARRLPGSPAASRWSPATICAWRARPMFFSSAKAEAELGYRRAAGAPRPSPTPSPGSASTDGSPR